MKLGSRVIIVRAATDAATGWKRELWEWLLAVAAMITAVWLVRTTAQAIVDAIIPVWSMS